MKRILLFGAMALISLPCVFAQNPPPEPPGGMPPPSASPDGMPPPPPRGMRGGDRHFDPKAISPEFAENVVKMMPEKEQTRLMELAKTDRNAFYAEVRTYLEKMRETEMQEIRDLKKRYAEAKTEEQKKAVREELRQKIATHFDRQLKMAQTSVDISEKRVREMEKKVEQSKAQLQKNKENRDAIVDRITDDILSGKKPPKHKPDGRPHGKAPHNDDGMPPPPPPEER